MLCPIGPVAPGCTRAQAAERALTPLPPYRILPPDMEQDRKHFEPDPDSDDTLVVSMHTDAMMDLVCSPYEAAALLWVALEAAGKRRPEGPLTIRNWQLGLLLAPVDVLTRGEVLEAVDRLAARGFVKRVGPQGIWINPLAVRVVARRELPARLLMQGNAGKAGGGGNPSPPAPAPSA